MKRLLVAFVVIFALSSFTNPYEIVGKWQVIKVGFENGNVVEVREKWISFDKEGNILSGKVGKTATMEGEWMFRCPKNSIGIYFEEDEKNNGEFFVKRISDSQMILKRDSMKVYLSKME